MHHDVRDGYGREVIARHSKKVDLMQTKGINTYFQTTLLQVIVSDLTYVCPGPLHTVLLGPLHGLATTIRDLCTQEGIDWGNFESSLNILPNNWKNYTGPAVQNILMNADKVLDQIQYRRSCRT